MIRDCIGGAPKGTKLRAIEHPGFYYKGERMNTFANRSCVVSSKGAFFGHVPRFLNYENASDTACLTAFSQEEAKLFAAKQTEVASK